ncbi:DUF4383 domain-containing protein [Kutzneria sp. NPDC052558]|uniref:DUF4383 domain-containing protein n=1 Tax=Kutzneria sp. NPDC052558 TaxID=3364121 RepID=UPI0037CC9861
MTETSFRSRADASRLILLAEGILLMLLGVVAGFVPTPPGDVAVVAGFQINQLHAIALAITGLLAVLVSVRRRLVLPFAVLQLLAYGAAFLYGANIQGQRTPDGWQFNQADSWLHLGIAVVALVIAITVGATAAQRKRGIAAK